MVDNQNEAEFRSEESLKVLYAKFDYDMKKRARWKRFLLVCDQTLNVIWLNGSQDETCSSHIGRLRDKGKATKFQLWFCEKVLSKFEHSHCYKSRGE